jgi:hypothetical protein
MPPRTQAWLCIVINQLAFPGLGTILQGRRFGYGQAAIMVAGFCLTMAFMLWYLVCCARYMFSTTWDEGMWAAQYRPYLWAPRYGLGLCAVAWGWALFSSVGIWRQTRAVKGEDGKVE